MQYDPIDYRRNNYKDLEMNSRFSVANNHDALPVVGAPFAYPQSVIAEKPSKKKGKKRKDPEVILPLQPAEFKVIVIGCEAAGKTSLINNIFASYGPEPTINDERSQYKKQILVTTVLSMQKVLRYIKANNLGLSSFGSRWYSDYINDYPLQFINSHVPFVCNRIPQEVSNALVNLWKDPQVREVYRSVYPDDKSVFFIENMAAFSRADYVPSYQDIAVYNSCQESLNKISSIEVYPNDNAELGFTSQTQVSTQNGTVYPYKFIEISPQSTNLAGWSESFLNCKMVVATVPVDSGEKLVNSLILFEAICNSRWFYDKPVLLLFTKADLFTDAMAREILLSTRFFPPELVKKESTFPRVLLEKEFVQAERRTPHRGKPLYTFWVSLLDQQQTSMIARDLAKLLQKHK